MSYLLLIMEEPGVRERRTEVEARTAYDRMMAYAESLRSRGLCRASESLRSLTDGARVESRGGKRLVVEGPFAEAKEMIGGFFLLDCDTKAEAVAIASECPAAEWAAVEVREIGPCTRHRGS
jgi:hypothetical protein